jgi:hypothetical protein
VNEVVCELEKEGIITTYPVTGRRFVVAANPPLHDLAHEIRSRRLNPTGFSDAKWVGA